MQKVGKQLQVPRGVVKMSHLSHLEALGQVVAGPDIVLFYRIYYLTWIPWVRQSHGPSWGWSASGDLTSAMAGSGVKFSPRGLTVAPV